MSALPSVVQEAEYSARILCIDQFSNIGGGQQSLLDMLPAFSERGLQPSVAIPGDGPFSETVRRRGYRTHSFACGTYTSKKKSLMQLLNYGFELPNLVHALSELMATDEIDLLYVNGPRLVPPAAWLAWRKGIPLIFHCHNRLLQPSAIALTGLALELASAHVIACCQNAAEPLREYVAPDRLRILYNGVAEMSAGDLRFPDRIRKIGVVGRIEVEKGQLEFVKAARLVFEKVPECRFTVIGSPMFSGFDYYRKVVASSHGLPIDFVDWQNDIRKLYSGLDLLVVPSGAPEATTRVIPEAYSAGVPVVSFPVGGIPEILEDGRTGFLAENVTVEALANRILSIVRMEPASVRAVIKRARKEWNDRFTLRAYREAVCDVLAQAMGAAVPNHYAELRNTTGVFTD